MRFIPTSFWVLLLVVPHQFPNRRSRWNNDEQLWKPSKHTNTILERHLLGLLLEANSALHRGPCWAQGTAIQQSQLCTGHISLWGNHIYADIQHSPAIPTSSWAQRMLWKEDEKKNRKVWRPLMKVSFCAGWGWSSKHGGCYCLGRAVDLAWCCCWQVTGPVAAVKGNSPFLKPQDRSRNVWWHINWLGVSESCGI